MTNRRLWISGIGLAIVVGVLLAINGRELERTPEPRGAERPAGAPSLATAPGQAPAPEASPAARPAPAGTEAEVDALDRAMAAADTANAREAARDLRRRLRTDPAKPARGRIDGVCLHRKSC